LVVEVALEHRVLYYKVVSFRVNRNAVLFQLQAVEAGYRAVVSVWAWITLEDITRVVIGGVFIWVLNPDRRRHSIVLDDGLIRMEELVPPVFN